MKELNFFSDYLAKRYGRKLYRIPLDLALGCPNREGGFGAGCAFCAEDGSRARHLSRHLDLAGQVAAGVEFARCRYGAEPPYIAYFQAFTSTFAPAEKLRRLYREALAAADFKVVIIGTRPDALPEPVLDLLSELAREYELWIELGVQSSHDRTLELIRRGHDFVATVKAANQLAERGINAACHVIAGLPGESAEDFFRTAERIAALPFRAVKLHQLLTLKKTPLASPEFPVKPQPLNEYEYMEQAAEFLHRLPDDWLVMRLIAEADPETILAPRWWMSKGQFLELFREKFNSGCGGMFTGVATADGSPTLYHPGFRQHFHSLAGAATESLRKFVEPAALAERLKRGPVRLLDVGFGLGANAAAAVRCAQETRGELEILTLELDPRVLEASAKLYAADSVEARLIGALRRDGYYAENGIRVTLLTGDARQSVRQLDGPFDVIFQDGFSPDCNPELWSYDFVRELARRLAPGGVLTSYCSAFPFRGALLRNGLQVGESVPFGRKRGGTVAAFDPALLPVPLPEKERGIICRSTAGVCYRDPSLTGTRETLFARRERLVRRLRNRGVPKWFKA
ncbi:MAG: TIGR01212 family radical SAM protein [Victivallis vadensis]